MISILPRPLPHTSYEIKPFYIHTYINCKSTILSAEIITKINK